MKYPILDLKPEMTLLWDEVSQAVQDVLRKGPQLLCCFHQPVQNPIGIDPKDSGGGPNASSLRQARQHVHDQLHRRLFTMKNRAMMFGEIAVT